MQPELEDLKLDPENGPQIGFDWAPKMGPKNGTQDPQMERTQNIEQAHQTKIS